MHSRHVSPLETFHPLMQERKAVDQWLEAASRCMDAAKEPLNAFHWDTRRMMTTDDLIAQLRSASISHQVLDAAKPSLEREGRLTPSK